MYTHYTEWSVFICFLFVFFVKCILVHPIKLSTSSWCRYCSPTDWLDIHLATKRSQEVAVDHRLDCFMKPWPRRSICKRENLDSLAHIVWHDFVNKREHCVGCGLPLQSFGKEMKHMGRHQQPIKNRRTQTNKVAANCRGKEGGGGERGMHSTGVECFLVLMLHKQELFPPAEQYKGWYCPWLGRGCRAHLERMLSCWVMCSYALIFLKKNFYASRAIVYVFIGMRGNSNMGLFVTFYETSESYQTEIATCVMMEVWLRPHSVNLSLF